MGRDWTPFEHHSADARLGFSKRKMEVTDIDGNISVLYDPDCETAKRFPNLYFLFHEGTEDILKKYGEKAVDAMTAAEEALADEINGSSSDPVVSKWYRGQLDPHFYYGMLNNSRLSDYIASQIRL